MQNLLSVCVFAWPKNQQRVIYSSKKILLFWTISSLYQYIKCKVIVVYGHRLQGMADGVFGMAKLQKNWRRLTYAALEKHYNILGAVCLCEKKNFKKSVSLPVIRSKTGFECKAAKFVTEI